MCKKHHGLFNDHMKYIKNDTQDPYKLDILDQAERVSNIYELAH